jgi:hypothetical protein
VIEADRIGGSALEDGIENHTGAIAMKWQGTCGHLVKNHTEREKVGTCVESLRTDLFRRHVGNSAKSCARTGEMFRVKTESGKSVGGAR